MLDGGKTLTMGWKPESGFLKARWDTDSELMMIYLPGLGSRAHPPPAATWNAWKRPIFHYEGLSYIGSRAPLFINQYSQAWFDFRHGIDLGITVLMAENARTGFVWKTFMKNAEVRDGMKRAGFHPE